MADVFVEASKEEILDGEWMNFASCKDMDIDYFYDSFEKSENNLLRRRVIAMCDMCPVNLECYEYAKLTRSTGVFGGHYFWIGRPIKDSLKFKRLSEV